VRYTGFLVTGLVVGLVAAILVWAFGSGDPRYPAAAALGYLVALGGLVGAILGGTVGVVVETVTTRRYRRRATRGR
jgi:membrane associated rhomboid family serine protease